MQMICYCSSFIYNESHEVVICMMMNIDDNLHMDSHRFPELNPTVLSSFLKINSE